MFRASGFLDASAAQFRLYGLGVESRHVALLGGGVKAKGEYRWGV